MAVFQRRSSFSNSVAALAVGISIGLQFSVAALGDTSTRAAPETNLRESCRRAASGAYLNAWDRKLQTARMVDSVASKLKVTATALDKEQKNLMALREKLRLKGYDLELAQAVDSKSGLVRTLEGQIAELEEVLIKTKLSAAETASTEAARKKEVMLVFDIKNAPKSKRPTRLDYKAQCPKYRFLCPLPRDHAIQLRETTTLESCTRYAEQSLSNR